MTKLCEWCEKPLPAPTSKRGRPRIYCSPVCRQEAYQERRLLQPLIDYPAEVCEEPELGKPGPPSALGYEAAVREVMSSPAAIKQVVDRLLVEVAIGRGLTDESYRPVIGSVVVLYRAIGRLTEGQFNGWAVSP